MRDTGIGDGPEAEEPPTVFPPAQQYPHRPALES